MPNSPITSSPRNMPMVSIIIPVFNGGNYLKDAIESALAQNYSNYEVLVINDGSNDNGITENIAKNYGDKIRYFHKKNGGCGTALNVGIGLMRGDLFSWLSHDDLYTPNKIRDQVSLYLKQVNQNSIIFSGFKLINENNKEIATVKPDEALSLRQLQEPLLPLLRGLIHGCTLLIPKKLFTNIGTFDEEQRTTQDYALWFNFLRQAPLVLDANINTISRIHPDQDTQKINKLHIEECNRLWIGFINRLSKNEKVRVSGSEYLFHKQMLEHLEKTPYIEAKFHAKKIVNNYLQKISVSIILIIDQTNLTERQIIDTIHSAQNQTHTNVEIFILNLAPHFSEIINKIILDSTTKNIFHLNINNENILFNIKNILMKINSHYISFLKAPDLFINMKISTQIQDMEEKLSRFSYTNYFRVSEGREIDEVDACNYINNIFARIVCQQTNIKISTVSCKPNILKSVPFEQFFSHQLTWDDVILTILAASSPGSGCPLALSKIDESPKVSIGSDLNSCPPILKVIDTINFVSTADFFSIMKNSTNSDLLLLISTEFNEYKLKFSKAIQVEDNGFGVYVNLQNLNDEFNSSPKILLPPPSLHFADYEGKFVSAIKPLLHPKLWTVLIVPYRLMRKMTMSIFN